MRHALAPSFSPSLALSLSFSCSRTLARSRQRELPLISQLVALTLLSLVWFEIPILEHVFWVQCPIVFWVFWHGSLIPRRVFYTKCMQNMHMYIQFGQNVDMAGFPQNAVYTHVYRNASEYMLIWTDFTRPFSCNTHQSNVVTFQKPSRSAQLFGFRRFAFIRIRSVQKSKIAGQPDAFWFWHHSKWNQFGPDPCRAFLPWC